MAQAGVTGVLCIQTKEDIQALKIDWPLLQASYASSGIKLVHFPIADFVETELAANLIRGATELNRMRQEGLNVYVHCTYGQKRSPAIVVAYLAMYKPSGDYGDVSSQPDLVSRVTAYVASFRTKIIPSADLIKKALAAQAV